MTKNPSNGLESEIQAESEALPRSRTLGEIFERNKAAALKAVGELLELMPRVELDAWFYDDDAEPGEDRPIRPLRLAQRLVEALENIARLKRIFAEEKWDSPPAQAEEDVF